MAASRLTLGLNEQIADHARNATGWRHKNDAEWYYGLFDRINAALFEDSLPKAVIGFDDSGRLKQDGAYHFEGDGLGLKHHIAIRTDLGRTQGMAAMVHNMKHMHQELFETSSKNWYHTTKFRSFMKSVGVTTKPNGDTSKLNDLWKETAESVGEIFEPDFQVSTPPAGVQCEVCGEDTCSGIHVVGTQSKKPSVKPNQNMFFHGPHLTKHDGGEIYHSHDTTSVDFFAHDHGDHGPDFGGPNLSYEPSAYTNTPKKATSGTKTQMVKWSCAGIGHKVVNIRMAVNASLICADCLKNDNPTITNLGVLNKYLFTKAPTKAAKELPF